MTAGTDGDGRRLGRAPTLRWRSAPGNRWASSVLTVQIILGCALLVGCGGPRLAPANDAEAPAGAGTPIVSIAPLPKASPVPSLGEIVWVTSVDPVTNAPRETVKTYSPQAPRISASVFANALPAGSIISADWEYNDTSLDAFSRQVIVPTPTDQTWISFHIDRGEAEAWPVGIYEVAIFLNGQLARQAAVEVVAQA